MRWHSPRPEPHGLDSLVMQAGDRRTLLARKKQAGGRRTLLADDKQAGGRRTLLAANIHVVFVQFAVHHRVDQCSGLRSAE